MALFAFARPIRWRPGACVGLFGNIMNTKGRETKGRAFLLRRNTWQKNRGSTISDCVFVWGLSSRSLWSWAPAAPHAHIHSITFVRYFPKKHKGKLFFNAIYATCRRETTQRNRKSSYRPVSASVCERRRRRLMPAKGK